MCHQRRTLAQFSPIRQVSICSHGVVFVQWDFVHLQFLAADFHHVTQLLAGFETPTSTHLNGLEITPTPGGIRVWFTEGGVRVQFPEWSTFTALFQQGASMLGVQQVSKTRVLC